MIRTPKFELQIELTDQRLRIMAVNSLMEARKEIRNAFTWCRNMTGNFYLWPNSRSGRSYFINLGCDYYSIIYDYDLMNKKEYFNFYKSFINKEN